MMFHFTRFKALDGCEHIVPTASIQSLTKTPEGLCMVTIAGESHEVDGTEYKSIDAQMFDAECQCKPGYVLDCDTNEVKVANAYRRRHGLAGADSER